MTKPISDKAEVAVEYPDKLYIGTFAHTARFDAHLDQSGIDTRTAGSRRPAQVGTHALSLCAICRGSERFGKKCRGDST